MRRYDALLVLGGGLRARGELPLWARRRLDRAVALHDGEYIIPLSAGTTHKPPPLDAHGHPIVESLAAARYLVDRGVAPDRILPEACSYDTIGNAFFARVIHTDPRALDRLLVITSAFHMPRTEAIFRWIFGLPPSNYRLAFEAVADEGMDAGPLAARREREGRGRARVHDLARSITTLDQLHRWLFTSHRAYAITPGPHRPVADDLGEAIHTY